jgi:histidyl-tRNA synthetase
MKKDFLKLHIVGILSLIVTYINCEDINPELKPILEKLDLDKKYHGLANEIYNKADRAMSAEKNNPLKHLQGLNDSVKRLLRSIRNVGKLAGTETETLGKKVLNFANEEFDKYFVAEPDLRANYNMSDKDIVKFKEVYDDTKNCIEKLNVIFNCA